MPFAVLSASDQRRLVHVLAGSWARLYQGDILLPTLARHSKATGRDLPEVVDALESSFSALRTVLGHYAFIRRGPAAEGFASLAVDALDSYIGDDERLAQLLGDFLPPTLWDAIIGECARRGVRPNEQINRTMVDGILLLAHDLYREDGEGNILHWIRDSVLRGRPVKTVFERLVRIRSLGPKSASLLMRDTAWLYDVEHAVPGKERNLLQPVDVWHRRVADYLFGGAEADWELAGRMTGAAQEAGVSGIALNMGVHYFGSAEVRHPQNLDASIRALLS